VLATAVIDVTTDPQAPSISVDGLRVDAEIRGPEVTGAVSAVAAVPAVRAAMVAHQREIIGDGGVVVEGRDIGAVVAPDAVLKVFLTASPEARAQRRSAELPGADLSTTHADLLRRDSLDSSRKASPLQQAADAVVLDSTSLGIDEVVSRLLGLLAADEPAGVRP
jgi:cytidylate kinase